MRDLFSDLGEVLNPNMAYYNTTNLKGAELKEAQNKAFKQSEVVYDLFTRYGRLSPSQCLQKYIEVTRLTPPPITSIRRAITQLTDAGKLEKTDERVMGNYGKKEYVWRKL